MQGQKISLNNLKALVLPIGFLVFTFVFGFIVVLPKAKEIFVLRTKMEKQKEEMIILERKVKTLNELSNTDLKNKLELSLKALPTQINAPLMLSMMEQLASQNNLDLKDFSLGDDFVFECVFEGDKNNFESFFTNLEKSLPIVAVQEIKLTDVDDKFQVEFSLKTFSLDIEEKIKLPEKISLLSEGSATTLEELEKFIFFTLPTSGVPVSATDSRRTNPF